MAVTTVTRRPARWVTLTGVVLLALNLRAAIAAVAPLLPDIRADLQLSRGAAGLLTTLPVLCFAVLSPAAAGLGRRVGLERALLAAMLAVAAGSALRLLPGLGWLLAGTVVIGAAITVGNVLVPSAVKQDFPDAQGTVTGLYTAALTGGAALAAALSAPLAHAAGLGWRGSLLVWAGLALVAAAGWLPQLRRRHGPTAEPVTGPSVRTSPVTWQLAGFMGMQALTFYALLAWMPDLLQETGVSAVGAGWALALFNLLGMATALTVPRAAGARRDQRGLVVAVCGVWAVGLVGLLLAPSAYVLWAVLTGLAQGAGISLALTLIVLRARTPAAARELSGTVQSAGYLLGAAGPFVAGTLRDRSGGWGVSVVALVVAVGLMAVCGIAAARDREVG